MIVFFGLDFWFDALFIEWLGRNNSFAYLVGGFLSAVACYLIIRRTPGSVRYVPYIINLPLLLSSLVGDFDSMYLPGWILTAITSALGYYFGMKKVVSSHGRR